MVGIERKNSSFNTSNRNNDSSPNTIPKNGTTRKRRRNDENDNNNNNDDNTTTTTSTSTAAFHSLIAGSVAGVASTVVCHPFDVLRVRMQSSSSSSSSSHHSSNTMSTSGPQGPKHSQGPRQKVGSGVLATLRRTVHESGGNIRRALYTGLTVPLLAQAVYKATVFTVNNVTESTILSYKAATRTPPPSPKQRAQEPSSSASASTSSSSSSVASPPSLTLMDRFVSGFMGGAINAALFCTPVEYVRNQQIVQIGSGTGTGTGTGSTTTGGNKSSSSVSSRSPTSDINRSVGPMSVIRRTIKEHGLRGLWRGVMSTVLRDSVGCGLFFVAMAYTQQQQQQKSLRSPFTDNDHNDREFASSSSKPTPTPSPSTSTIILSGAVAGVAYWLWALPVDTIKTWIQSGKCSTIREAIGMAIDTGRQRQQQHSLSTGGHGGASAVTTTTNTAVADGATTAAGRGGLRTLFRGWQVAYTRGAPSAAITVTTYQLVYQYLHLSV